MTTALADRPTDALGPVVTPDQLDLVKRTVASGATDAELRLYLFDCARQGVHPLDKLLHFTKRAGKYTPVTSIDLMRTRAADTNEYAGSDDAVFNGTPKADDFTATVTVWRFVQGQRCAFTATARWSEYRPEAAHMWQKMPHTMLAKCAEALALRKGFPRQLAGLYAKEEMDQADTPRPGGYVVEAPAASPSLSSGVVRVAPSKPNGGDSDSRPSRAEVLEGSAQPSGSIADDGPDMHADLPEGTVRIEKVEMFPTNNPNVKKYLLVLSNGEQMTTVNERWASLAEQVAQERCPVRVQAKSTKWGRDLVKLERAQPAADVDHSEPLDADSIPF